MGLVRSVDGSTGRTPVHPGWGVTGAAKENLPKMINGRRESWSWLLEVSSALESKSLITLPIELKITFARVSELLTLDGGGPSSRSASELGLALIDLDVACESESPWEHDNE
ncbi:hypothetical protein Dimus_011364 [Dionaea muscipula]